MPKSTVYYRKNLKIKSDGLPGWIRTYRFRSNLIIFIQWGTLFAPKNGEKLAKKSHAKNGPFEQNKVHTQISVIIHWFNSHACGMTLLEHCTFKRISCKFFPAQSIQIKMFIPIFKIYKAFILLRFCQKSRWAEKKCFLTGWSSPENQILTAVKI